MALHWKRRLTEWATHVRSMHGRVPWWRMLAALASGPVTADVWRHRIRTCARCPVKNQDAWVCGRPLRDGRFVGCNCNLVFLCLTAVPYSPTGGCWLREIGDPGGWPAVPHKNAWAKLRATLRFIFA